MPVKKRSSRNVQPPRIIADTKSSARKTALVTGASNGIGYDLASILAESGFNVVLVARSREKLLALANQAQQMFGVSATVIQKDLTDPNAPAEVARELQRKGIHIDVLVNNAGYGMLGPFAYTNREDQLNMIRLNVEAVAAMTQQFLPGMLKRRSGRILNVASTAAFQPGPLMSNYYATKSYVLNFSIGLAEEVRGQGVTVSVLCPGSTFTGFQERAGIKRNPLPGFTRTDSRIVARAGYEGLMAGKTVIVPGILNKTAVVLSSLVKRTFAAKFLRKVNETRR